MLNPANGGASVGVWGRNPSAIMLMLSESVNSTLICAHQRLLENRMALPDEKLLAAELDWTRRMLEGRTMGAEQ